MPKVVTARGYAVNVFTDDHGAPHAHVRKDGVLLKITLKPVAFGSAKHGRPSERTKRAAIAVVEENLELCWTVGEE